MFMSTYTDNYKRIIFMYLKMGTKMDPNKLVARYFGVFFILAFITYGAGSSIVASIANEADSLASIYANKAGIVIGVILMALLHSFVNIGLPVVMFPLLKPINERFTYAYLSAGISATVVLIGGTVFTLLLLPLSDTYMEAGSAAGNHFETLRLLSVKGGFYAYQLGMAVWGIGGLFLTTLLYQSKLVPRFISVWGFIGYIIFMVGTILELYGYGYGVQLALPGGLFELFLSFWLIIKGFNSSDIA